jgi:hypothetical protein
MQVSKPLVVMVLSLFSSLSRLWHCSTRTYYDICLPTLKQTNPLQKMAMGTLHPAVSAIMKAADVGQANNPDVLMRIKLLAKCQSVCAIEGLFEGRGVSANLVLAAAPVVSSSNADCCVCFCHPPTHP